MGQWSNQTNNTKKNNLKIVNFIYDINKVNTFLLKGYLKYKGKK